MPKTVAIVQSNYIPWKGYFDLIGLSDEFILYDDVQFTKRDWRNRNKIKTPTGPQWLTIPVLTKGKFEQPINQTEIGDMNWPRKHWPTIVQNYAKAPHFAEYRERFQTLYEECSETMLSKVNHRFLAAICWMLGIGTKISWSSDYPLADGKTERLVGLCKAAGATTYLSGPAAKAYMDESLFAAQGIDVKYMDYTGYAEYDQLYPPFEHGVSVLDLIFHTGADAPRYLKFSSVEKNSSFERG
jgi:hypothetical protein